jgi:hypothetical protein
MPSGKKYIKTPKRMVLTKKEERGGRKEERVFE